MNIYVVWSNNYELKETNIIGVYKRSSSALQKCNSHNLYLMNRKDIYKVTDNLVNNEIRSDNDICHCCVTKSKKEINKVYILYICEDGGAESYSYHKYIYIYTKLNDAIDDAMEYYQQNHSENDSETQSSNGKDQDEVMFKKNLMRDFKKGESTCFMAGRYEASLRIEKMMIQ